MKAKRNRNVPNPAARSFSMYEPSFKRAVILYAEQKGNSEARRRYGITDDTIKRWMKRKREILETAQQCVRRSQRHASHGASDSNGAQASKAPPNDLDSMPLQQRLSQSHNDPVQTQEAVLQSQPISPTKLKVTRQGARPTGLQKSPTPTPQQRPEVCLKWNSHHANMQSAFPNLLMKEQYVDATLVAEGKTLKCHRMILSSCSPYFEDVLSGIGPFQHPVIFMKDIPFWILKALCDFMYAGEVHLLQDKLQELLKVADALQIKGLAGSPDLPDDVKPLLTEIKQETESQPMMEKYLKEERLEEASQPSKFVKHEPSKPSKKKEDKKAKHPVAKEKEKFIEEPPPKAPQKVTLAPKAAPIVKNALKNSAKVSTSKSAHSTRKSDLSRRGDKHKPEASLQKEKEKEKEKPALKKDNINDPLDLLQPVYEEIAKEDPPPSLKSINPGKLKERGNVQMKRGIKKVKKRRYADYVEDREESPPPVFHSRKGTRSRPNVKIPKFFHTHYDESQKESADATIVREPHTDQNDPLIGVEVEEIKAEPVDVEENTIDMEDNLVSFMEQDQLMTSQEGEEIIGNYDSPIVNIRTENKSSTPNIFKKIMQPVIMNVHTVSEGEESHVKLLAINEDRLQIVDISKINSCENQLEETIIGESLDQSGEPTSDKPSEIKICNVQSIAEICEENKYQNSEETVTGNTPEDEISSKSKEDEEKEEKESQLPAEAAQPVFNFRIESVTSNFTQEIEPLESQNEELKKEETTLGRASETQEQETGSDTNQCEAPPPTEVTNEQSSSETCSVHRGESEEVASVEPEQNSEDTNNALVKEQLTTEERLESANVSEKLGEDSAEEIQELGEARIESDNVCEKIVEETQELDKERIESNNVCAKTVEEIQELGEEGIENDNVCEELVEEGTHELSDENLRSDNVCAELLEESPVEIPEPRVQEERLLKTEEMCEISVGEAHVIEDRGQPIAMETEDEQEINSIQEGEELMAICVQTDEDSEQVFEQTYSESIEAELEECLASSSSFMEDKSVPTCIPYNDTEDFTKDIEFDNFIGRSGPATYFMDENQTGEERDRNIDADQQFEDSLLADLDDDIAMEAEGGRQTDDGSEKTLEMIVNDLNESLGELKK